jgi:hypothetical protein
LVPCRFVARGEIGWSRRAFGRRPSDIAIAGNWPCSLAAQDVDDVLHRSVDALESAVVSSDGFQQGFGWRVIRQQRIQHFCGAGAAAFLSMIA